MGSQSNLAGKHLWHMAHTCENPTKFSQLGTNDCSPHSSFPPHSRASPCSPPSNPPLHLLPFTSPPSTSLISHCSSYTRFIEMFPLLYTLPKSQLTILPDFLIVTSSYSISLHCYLFYYLTMMYTMPIQQSDYQPSFPPS